MAAIKLQTKINLIGTAFIAVPIFIVVAVGVKLLRGGDTPPRIAKQKPQLIDLKRETAELQKVVDEELQNIVAAEPPKLIATHKHVSAWVRARPADVARSESVRIRTN